jgi:DNA-binding XRE family transcriptional regulator
MCKGKTKEISKLTLKGYYEDLKRTQESFINKVATECGVTRQTVYNWLNGKYIVPVLAQEKINTIVQKELLYEN